MVGTYEISDSESDQDLAEAIRLSLLEPSNPASPPRDRPQPTNNLPATASTTTTKRKADVIDLVSDDDGDEEASDLDEVDPTWKAPKASNAPPARPPHPGGNSRAAAGGLSALMGHSRAQMERERLERVTRLKKARGGGDDWGPAAGGTAHHVRSNYSLDLDPVSAPSGRSVQPQRQIHTLRGDSSYTDGGALGGMQKVVPYYPNGIVRKTWAQGLPKTATDITFEEVIQKETIYMAVLSAFQWHYNWVLGKLPFNKLQKLVMVMHAKGQEDREYKREAFGELARTTLVLPPMEGQVSCMHSKLMLLFHKSRNEKWLRVVVPSGNLTDFDWGERGGIMENMVFLIDLPRLESPKPDQTPFAKELHHFCSAKGIPDDILASLHEYDFGKTKHMAFVHSIGGSNGGDGWKRTGYCGLGTAIKSLGYGSGPGLQVDYVTSSLGAANAAFISNMYRAAMGDNGLRELERRTNKPKNAKKRKTEEEQVTDDDSGVEHDEETNLERIMNNLRIYFPSRDTVAASKGGIMAGGTICFQPQWWNSPTFPKSIVRDCQSVREGMLMHNKLLFARPSKQLQTAAGKVDAWAYVGSANFSESAWGKLVTDRSSKSPKINCKNWECGVVLPVPAPHTLSQQPVEQVGMCAFATVVPVPMKVPAAPMGVKRPWFFGEGR